ncbi:MAG TPA: acyl carrier protein [Lachnospiraceae bacterium]|mgnify:CR=1 FL=1|nr:acyl carrier protein [uncultured Lachnoclostridium sp.]HAU84825.1 acyl carrier protein [Lachnospiraceae bacterium]
MELIEVKTKVKEIIAEIIEMEVDEFKDTDSFVDDLGLDSLKALEILAAVEKEFKIEIPEEKLAELTTVDNTVSIAMDIINQ